MGFKSDIEIAQECEMRPITEIAAKAGIDDKYLEQYGKYKAKIDYNLLKESDAPNGKLILVTAINPTPAGEGKTVIEADIPMACLNGYCTDLRSMTGGRGNYMYTFARYEQAPSDVQAKEVAARAGKVAESGSDA